MRTFLNTERRRENKPEPPEDDEVEAVAACVVDEHVHTSVLYVCLETETLAGESLIDEGRSSVVVGSVDEECS